MSDVRPGPAWWQGVDGRWYPPEQRPVGWTDPGGGPTRPAGATIAAPPVAAPPAVSPVVAPAGPFAGPVVPAAARPPGSAPPVDGPPRAIGYGVAAAIGIGGLLVAAVLFVALLFVGGRDPTRTHLLAVPGERQVELAPGPLVLFADPAVVADPPTIAVSGPNGDEPVSRVDPGSDFFITSDGRQLEALARISPSVSGTYRFTTSGAPAEHPLVLAPSSESDISFIWPLLALLFGLGAVVAGVAVGVVTAVRRASWRSRHPAAEAPANAPVEVPTDAPVEAEARPVRP